MLFTEITFLYYFLPLTLAVYYVTPPRGKNAVLFGASILFYFWGEPVYVFLLLGMLLFGYAGGRWTGAALQEGRKDKAKVRMLAVIAAQLAVLVIFKYAGLSLALPLGISFYTFQLISYLVDVYRGDVEAEPDFICFGAYIAMFPQLVAGPIVRYQEIAPCLKAGANRGIANFAEGMPRFLCGLAKKVLIGDVLGELVTSLDGLEAKSPLLYWGIAVAFVLQLYYDFSGYSDMAAGLGKMLGFHFPENFAYPLTAKSVTEFWRRWHMTLGNWLRDYLYIPLGGNRVSFPRWVFHVLFVWMVSGIWHGAGLNFAVWGLYFGIFLILEKIMRRAAGKWKIFSFFQEHRLLRLAGGFAAHLYTLAVITVSFVLFRITEWKTAGTYLAGMFGFGSGLTVDISPAAVDNCLAFGRYQLKNYAVVLLLAAVGATPLVKKITKWIPKQFAIQLLAMAAVYVLVTAFLVGSTAHPFLYFRF